MFYFTNCKYLFDKHKPPPLKSRLARARGLEVNVNVGHQSPACGLKFGEAGLLGRGRGRDLDSDTECVQGFLYCIAKAIIRYIHTYYQVRGVPLARRHPLHAGRGHGVRVRRRAG